MSDLKPKLIKCNVQWNLEVWGLLSDLGFDNTDYEIIVSKQDDGSTVIVFNSAHETSNDVRITFEKWQQSRLFLAEKLKLTREHLRELENK